MSVHVPPDVLHTVDEIAELHLRAHELYRELDRQVNEFNKRNLAKARAALRARNAGVCALCHNIMSPDDLHRARSDPKPYLGRCYAVCDACLDSEGHVLYPLRVVNSTLEVSSQPFRGAIRRGPREGRWDYLGVDPGDELYQPRWVSVHLARQLNLPPNITIKHRKCNKKGAEIQLAGGR